MATAEPQAAQAPVTAKPKAADGDNKAGRLIDGEKGKVVSGSASGNSVTLKLAGTVNARTITYLDSKEWSQKTLLRGENGIAALTFCEVLLTVESLHR